MKKTTELLNNLKDNVSRIDAVKKNIKEIAKKDDITEEEQVALDSLYRNEFSLYMDNSSIYDDLLQELETEDEFTKRYIKEQANKLLKVGRMYV